MGYAKTSQTAHGIHQRLWARAFIISKPSSSSLNSKHDVVVDDNGQSQDKFNDMTMGSTFVMRRLFEWWFGGGGGEKSHNKLNKNNNKLGLDPSRSICFVSIDTGMGSDLLNQRVMERLEELLGQDELLCQLENLSISGTHTHSAPAGFLQYVIFQFTSMGFIQQVLDTYVEGVAQALVRAHDNLQQGDIHMAQDLLWDANINRSPSSYLLNPQKERDEYASEGDTDKTMVQLSFNAAGTGESLGVLNWFAVHGTSMNSTNQLLSGDNKGYASYLMEKLYNDNGTRLGQGSFVAAFASTNLGDVSPNTAGAHCVDTGLPCDTTSSTCNGRMDLCIASGPGKDMYESTEIIGRKQYEMALRLKNEFTPRKVQGDVAFRHSFIDMSHINVTLSNGTLVHTCKPALGYSFAAGTTDGPGDFSFHQGTNTSNPFWNMLGGFLSIPSEEQIACHAPKPILLNAGAVSHPYSWEPTILPISIFRIGSFFILNLPAELTTMAGRRLRKAVRQLLITHGVENPVITIAGLSNSYSQYVTTIEEYSGQRYEAASTLYGPHTLEAYIQEFRRITWDLLQDRPSTSTAPPPDLSRKQLSLLPPIELDTIGLGKSFGSVAVDAKDSYSMNEIVLVSFRSANPRNNLRIQDTFLTVDALGEDGEWQTLFVDGDWCTKYYWKGGLGYFGESFAEIRWDIPNSTVQGLYRVCHSGTRKTLLGGLELLILKSTRWLVTTVIGTPSLAWTLSGVDLAAHLSPRMKDWLNRLGGFRLRDFKGCSKTFLVHKS